jgi:hypothetical protein
MKPIIATIGLAFLALAAPATEALAVSAKDRQACERGAEQVRPALRAEEKEAWIANCLANASATQGGKY